MERTRDSETFRALAHPLRMRLLAALRLEGPATASTLGRRLGESSGSTSYHLRQLARYGFVGEDEAQPSRREKRWHALVRRTSRASAAFLDDPGAQEADRFVASRRVESAVRAAEQWLDTRESWPREWVEAAELSDYQPRLTPDALARLTRDIEALVERYEDECAGEPGIEQVHLYVQAVPGVTADLFTAPRRRTEAGTPRAPTTRG